MSEPDARLRLDDVLRLIAEHVSPGQREPLEAAVRAASSVPATQVTISRDVLDRYVEWHGGVHDDECPEDDTCDCSWKPVNDALNDALRERVVSPTPNPATYERIVDTGPTVERISVAEVEQGLGAKADPPRNIFDEGLDDDDLCF